MHDMHACDGGVRMMHEGMFADLLPGPWRGCVNGETVPTDSECVRGRLEASPTQTGSSGRGADGVTAL